MRCGTSLQWRHIGLNSVSKHQPRDYLLKRLKRRVTGLCAGNLPVSGEFPAQRASNTENVSIWWRHHVANGAGRNVVPFVITYSRRFLCSIKRNIGCKRTFLFCFMIHPNLNHLLVMYPYCAILLEERHISAMASQITSNLTVCVTAC